MSLSGPGPESGAAFHALGSVYTTRRDGAILPVPARRGIVQFRTNARHLSASVSARHVSTFVDPLIRRRGCCCRMLSGCNQRICRNLQRHGRFRESPNTANHGREQQRQVQVVPRPGGRRTDDRQQGIGTRRCRDRAEGVGLYQFNGRRDAGAGPHSNGDKQAAGAQITRYRRMTRLDPSRLPTVRMTSRRRVGLSSADRVATIAPATRICWTTGRPMVHRW